MYRMKTKPWAHQLKALDYLMVRHAGALYTDMGTGKTKVGIDLIVNKHFNLSLIVSTKKSCDVWEDEFMKHCGAKICVFNLSKLSTSKKTSVLKDILLQRQKNIKQVMIINYDSIWRKPFSEKLIKSPIDCVICDESHRIKSPGSKCSLYLTRLGKVVQNRYLFTGTPSTNSPVDVYAQYKFLDSSIFGTSFSHFRNRYENVDVQRTLYAGYRCLDNKQPYKNLEELKRKMYTCAFYVTTDLHLPATTDITTTFTPSNKLIAVYKELSKKGVYKDEQGLVEINNSLTMVLRKQQLLSGFIPMEGFDFTTKFLKQIDTSRQNVLQELLEGIDKHEKVVVFAKFRCDFDNIKKISDKLSREYGEISGVKDDYVAWKEGRINLLAVQYTAGAESIDLTQARYCIYYSLSHSYGLYCQSKKRIHRPNQKKPVVYYNIVCKIPGVKTVDEQIMKALSRKQDVAEYLLQENPAI